MLGAARPATARSVLQHQADPSRRQIDSLHLTHSLKSHRFATDPLNPDSSMQEFGLSELCSAQSPQNMWVLIRSLHLQDRCRALCLGFNVLDPKVFQRWSGCGSHRAAVAPDQSSQIWGWGHHDLEGMTCLLDRSGKGSKPTVASPGDMTANNGIKRHSRYSHSRCRTSTRTSTDTFKGTCTTGGIAVGCSKGLKEMVCQNVDSPPAVSS